MYKKAVEIFRKEPILLIALLLGGLSSVLMPVAPGKWIRYIDFHTLSLLFGLMLVSAALQQEGIFDLLGRSLIKRASTVRAMGAMLLACCFFSSMLITNDVALLAFVPLTLLSFRLADVKKGLLTLVALETIAANLGSMLLPTGNPQNLFLYEFANLSTTEFIKVMLPGTILSFLGLLACVYLLPVQSIKEEYEEEIRLRYGYCIFYGVLFIGCLGAVLRILPIYAVVGIVFLSLLLVSRETIWRVDYGLLLTFAGFFVFVGNISRIPELNHFLTHNVSGHEVKVGILLSQIISNVPAALLLARFSDHLKDLLLGTNLGGLGSLIASMASLISYKFLARSGFSKSRYIAIFTGLNLLFLLYLCAGLHMLGQI